MKRLFLILILAFYSVLSYGQESLINNQYCNSEYNYCAIIDDKLLPFYQPMNDGFRIVNKKNGTAFFMWGAMYDKDNEYDTKIHFVNQLTKHTVLNHKLIKDWHFSEYHQGADHLTMITQGSKKTAYRYWLYNDKGFVEFSVIYPNKYEKEISPMIQKMTQSIVLK